MKPLHLILLGPPASGKGTQGRRLAKAGGLAYLSTGALLREALVGGGDVAEQIRPVLERGGYISDELMCGLMVPWLEKNQHGWVLDGFPRSVHQDDFLGHWLAERGEAVDAAIALEVPQSDLLERIKARVECPDCRWSGQAPQLLEGGKCPECGGPAGPRDDDSVENFLSRHAEFTRHAVPVIERYAAAGKLRTCDATAPIDEVAQHLEETLQQLNRHGEKA